MESRNSNSVACWNKTNSVPIWHKLESPLVGSNSAFANEWFWKIFILPHGRLLEIQRGGGVSKAKVFKKKYEAKLEFLENVGWGVGEPPWGKYG